MQRKKIGLISIFRLLNPADCGQLVLMNNETLPTVNCLAQLDDVIQALPAIVPGPVARFSSGPTIFVRGQYRSRGWTHAIFREAYVRWEAPEMGKGLFGRGITTVPEAKVIGLRFAK